MVAINRRRIRCVVVAVPAENDVWSSRGALAQEIVPGADPYVAQLIQRLQDEVRHERRAEALREQRLATSGRRLETSTMRPRFEPHQLSADLEIPWFDMPLDNAPLGDDHAPEFGGDAHDSTAPAW